MKKCTILCFLLVVAISHFTSCNNEEEIDPGKSIFTTDPIERNEFDKWVLSNYTNPYNIDLKYRMEDIESDMTHVLVPADYDKSVVLAKIVKHVWIEAYDEVTGSPSFLRQYVPKTLHLIGSPAFEDNGTMVVGTAEGGMKVTLYNVNDLDVSHVDIEMLNEYYFETMHHEFCHILHQTKNFNPAFERITESDYIGGDWYLKKTQEAWKLGFVTPYAMSEAREDFVENIAMFVTHDETYWSNMLANAGTSGATIINKKFAIAYDYMKEIWGIDLKILRKVVLRRQSEVSDGVLDLSIIK